MKAPIWHRLSGLAALAIAFSCASPAGSPVPTATPGPSSSAMASPTVTPLATPTTAGRTLGGVALEQCTIGEAGGARAAALCGSLSVPEDPSKPSGRMIDLRVAVLPAISPDPASEPVFALGGGPGGASIQLFGYFPTVFGRIHQTRDVVLVDQRGTGRSNPLDMPPMPDVTGLDGAQADSLIGAWADDYFGSLDADPRMYTSTYAAEDIDAVRAALGYDKIDLYGPSYGATLALYYLRQHEDHVAVVVLDSGTPLDVPIFERMAPNSQAALDLLFDRCAADASCDAAFPDLREEWSQLLARLQAGPITTDVQDPATGELAKLTLVDVGNAVHSALVQRATAGDLPLLIHLAATNQWQVIGQLNQDQPSGGNTVQVMSEVIRCAESWARFDPAEVERLGADSYALEKWLTDARAQEQICRHMPAGVALANDGAPVVTDVPVLWLAADGDPQDPPANLAEIGSQQPNSRMVVVPVQNHTVGHLGCLPTVIADFLDAGSAADLDYSCVADRGLFPVTFRTR